MKELVRWLSALAGIRHRDLVLVKLKYFQFKKETWEREKEAKKELKAKVLENRSRIVVGLKNQSTKNNGLK